MVAQLPAVIEALTGVKLQEMIARLPQIREDKAIGGSAPSTDT